MTGMRFSVAAENMDAAVAWLAERGFAPRRIEQGDADVALVFPPMPDARLRALIAALPVHLSSKVGVVLGDRAPFSDQR